MRGWPLVVGCGVTVAAAIVTPAILLTHAGDGRAGGRGSPASPDGGTNVAGTTPWWTAGPPPSSAAIGTASPVTGLPSPTASFEHPEIAAPVEPWPGDVGALDVPWHLADGRAFDVAAVVDVHHVVGFATTGSLKSGTAAADTETAALVVLDAATGRVVRTLDTVRSTRAESWRNADWIDAVTPNGAVGSWVTWARGQPGDDGWLANATVYAEDLDSGTRVVLGTAESGDSGQLAPTVSGGYAAWADEHALHVAELGRSGNGYVQPIGGSGSFTFLDVFHWPWLSYEVRASTTTFHLVDLRNGTDRVESGICDGTWCEVATPWPHAENLVLVPQGAAPGAAGVTIASGLGGFGVFGEPGAVANSASGLYVWSDIAPYRADWGTAEDPMPADAWRHEYLYDPSAGRNVELPSPTDYTVLVSGHYAVLLPGSSETAPAGPTRLVDLDAVR